MWTWHNYVPRECFQFNNANQEDFLLAQVDANGKLHHILIEIKNSEKGSFVLYQQQFSFSLKYVIMSVFYLFIRLDKGTRGFTTTHALLDQLNFTSLNYNVSLERAFKVINNV